MRIITGLVAFAACLYLWAPLNALAHGARGLVNPPPGAHHRAPPAPPPHLAPSPGMFNPPPPLLQAPSPSPFVTPAFPYTSMQPFYPGWQPVPPPPPPFTHGDPSLRDRRLFEEELHLRQWHEHELRRLHGGGEHRRWHEPDRQR
ncbi:MAG: hypothetical protein Q7U14_00045 [Lacisediminimonas sp.]|nr:hypothetical protein [Lacisediminimonas sp.]